MSGNEEMIAAIAISIGSVALLGLMGVLLVLGVAWDSKPEAARAKEGETVSAKARPSGRTLLWRGLVRRCPVCGKGRVLESYFKMNARCSACGVLFWKNSGEALGPMVMDFTAGALMAFIAWCVAVFFGFAEAGQIAIAAAAAVAVPIAMAPWSRSLWTVLLYISNEM